MTNGNGRMCSDRGEISGITRPRINPNKSIRAQDFHYLASLAFADAMEADRQHIKHETNLWRFVGDNAVQRDEVAISQSLEAFSGIGPLGHLRLGLQTGSLLLTLCEIRQFRPMQQAFIVYTHNTENSEPRTTVSNTSVFRSLSKKGKVFSPKVDQETPRAVIRGLYATFRGTFPGTLDDESPAGAQLLSQLGGGNN